MSYEEWRRRLAAANDERLIPIGWIDRLLADGLAQFWATDQAAIVTQIVDYPGGARVVKALAAAGRKADIAGPLGDQIEQWARSQGCVLSMVEGREGWRRLRPDYRHYQAILIKEL